MKIAVICSALNNADAGVAGVTACLAEAYRAAGHEADDFYLDDIVGVGLRSRLAPFAFSLLLASKRKLLDYDVIDVASSSAWLMVLRLRFFARRRPLIVSRSHGLDHMLHEELMARVRLGEAKVSWKYPIYNGSLRLWEVKQSMRHADLCLLLNNRDQKYALDKLGIDANRMHVVDNGIPSSLIGLSFTPSREGPIRIAQIGSYIDRKGIRYGNEAIKNVLNRHKNVEMVFLGTGKSAKEVMADFPDSLHSRIQVHPHFRRDDLPMLLSTCQIKFFPSLSEGFGMAVVEAMACGLAPIITAIPGISERLRDGTEALIVPPRNVEAMSNALERLILEDETRKRIQQTAWMRAQDFSWTRVAADTIRIYSAGIEHRSIASCGAM
jgi:glycosyltransferase involved in cell wall biosynthesis